MIQIFGRGKGYFSSSRCPPSFLLSGVGDACYWSKAARMSLPSSMEIKNEWSSDIIYLYLLCDRRESEVMEVLYGCKERQLQYHTHTHTHTHTHI